MFIVWIQFQAVVDGSSRGVRARPSVLYTLIFIWQIGIALVPRTCRGREWSWLHVWLRTGSGAWQTEYAVSATTHEQMFALGVRVDSHINITEKHTSGIPTVRAQNAFRSS